MPLSMEKKASDWQLKKRMSSMNIIFHEAPGRHADYKTVTNSMEKVYIMQFITHRWVKNDVVAKKARVIWPKIIEAVYKNEYICSGVLAVFSLGFYLS